MSVEAIGQLLERAKTDRQFASQLRASFESTSATFDLTPDEKTLIKAGDYMSLQQLGIDKNLTEVLWKFLG